MVDPTPCYELLPRLPLNLFSYSLGIGPVWNTFGSAWHHFVVAKTKYTTLGPKIYNFSVFSPRICFCFVNPKFRKILAALDEYFAMAVSNSDLEPFWLFFWKFTCDLGFARYLKFKIIKVEIEVKLLKIYFVVRPWLHQQRIKRLNQRMKRTNTRFKQQFD